MKNLVLLLVAVIFTAFTVEAQVSTTDKVPEKKATEKTHVKKSQVKAKPEQTSVENNNPNAPDISFDKVVHDYGTLEQHGDGHCEFTFTNTGKEPLILSNVRSSCGCTVPTWPRQPVLPGQSEVIKVKYDTKRIGAINKSVHVYSNAKTSQITLKIKGKVVAKSKSQMPEKNIEKTGAPVSTKKKK